jgi:UDP-3-O-[3-hydroxymyristoyl] glucosamine N-acyltransferase
VAPDPRAAFIAAVPLVVDTEAQTGVHPRATVHPSAHLGSDVTLHPGVVVGPGCAVGDRTVLFPNVVLYAGTRVGADVRIHAGAVIGADGFGYHPTADGLKKMPHVGRVVVEDGVEIGANTCIDRAALGETRVRSGAKIDNLVQVAHHCDVGSGALLVAQTGLSGSVHVGTGAVLGGQVGVADHRRIGAGAHVGAQSGVHRDVPDEATVLGTPARPIAETRRIWAALRWLPRLVRR